MAELGNTTESTSTEDTGTSDDVTADSVGSQAKSRGLLAKLVVDVRPLRIPAFRRLWISTAVTAVGSQLTAVAVPFQVYDITHSSAYVGLAGLFALVPLLVFGLWGGAISDAVDRRKLLVVTGIGIALTSIGLWATAATHVGSVWPVLILLALQQMLFAVNQPARTAVIARLVPTELLPAASSLSYTVSSFGMVFGPLLAGAFIPLVGLSTLYLLDAVGLVGALFAVLRLPAMPPAETHSGRAGLTELLDGFRYLARHRIVLASFLVDIIAMVAGMPRALFPEMAERTFGDPPGGGTALGWLFAAIPIGALIFGFFSGWLSRIERQGVAVLVAISCWGLAVAGFGLVHSLWLAVLLLAIGGGADLVSAVFRTSMLQAVATDEMRGRLQGVFLVVVAGGPRVADLVHGMAGAAVGTTAATVGGGLLVLVLLVLAAVAIPAFWRYRAPVAAD